MNKSNHVRERGLSLVELMIGIAMSLFIIAGAFKVMAGHLESSRQSLLATRLDQDIRMATNMVAREIRRAGYWKEAQAGITSHVTSPRGKISILGTANAASITYSYDVEEEKNASEVSIFLRDGVLRLNAGNSGQPVTDAETVNVTRFAVTPHLTTASLGHLCIPVCSIDEAKCPRLQTRSYDISIFAQSVSDARLTRETHESVRVRNDELIQGTCP